MLQALQAQGPMGLMPTGMHSSLQRLRLQLVRAMLADGESIRQGSCSVPTQLRVSGMRAINVYSIITDVMLNPDFS